MQIQRRGYAKNERDERRLAARGVGVIYLEGRGHESFGLWKLRAGETLYVVDAFLAFGSGSRRIADAVKRVHDRGAVVEDAETGLRSDRDGAEMMASTLSKRASLTPDRARELQAKGVPARWPNRKVMPEREAAGYWRDPRLTLREALEAMYGWKKSAAYDRLGKRGVPTGRRAAE